MIGLRLLAALFAVAAGAAAAGCSSDDTGSASNQRVDRCVERFVERIEELGPPAEGEISMDEYARRAYCLPLERRGWVYDDGTLSIEAVSGGSATCVEEAPGGPARTVPCEAERIVDCALLHLVRRPEAQAYVATLPEGAECDDGTPLDRLGAD